MLANPVHQATSSSLIYRFRQQAGSYSRSWFILQAGSYSEMLFILRCSVLPSPCAHRSDHDARGCHRPRQ